LERLGLHVEQAGNLERFTQLCEGDSIGGSGNGTIGGSYC
jgi:hypothetical protein